MLGLLGEAPRKSLEPVAAQLCPDTTKVDALHQRLQHFLVDVPGLIERSVEKLPITPSPR